MNEDFDFDIILMEKLCPGADLIHRQFTRKDDSGDPEILHLLRLCQGIDIHLRACVKRDLRKMLRKIRCQSFILYQKSICAHHICIQRQFHGIHHLIIIDQGIERDIDFRISKMRIIKRFPKCLPREVIRMHTGIILV